MDFLLLNYVILFFLKQGGQHTNQARQTNINKYINIMHWGPRKQHSKIN